MVTNGSANDGLSYRLLRDEAAEQRSVARHDTFELDGVQFEVLWPPAGFDDEDPNEGSLVIRVRYGDASVLLAGDVEQAAQQQLAALDIAAQVLKVPHHGGSPAGGGFADAVGAAIAVISAGAGNPFGHPSPDVVEQLTGSIVLRTDIDGTVSLRTDGRHWKIERRE
jgi:competence protein ComEC